MSLWPAPRESYRPRRIDRRRLLVAIAFLLCVGVGTASCWLLPLQTWWQTRERDDRREREAWESRLEGAPPRTLQLVLAAVLGREPEAAVPPLLDAAEAGDAGTQRWLVHAIAELIDQEPVLLPEEPLEGWCRRLEPLLAAAEPTHSEVVRTMARLTWLRRAAPAPALLDAIGPLFDASSAASQQLALEACALLHAHAARFADRVLAMPKTGVVHSRLHRYAVAVCVPEAAQVVEFLLADVATTTAAADDDDDDELFDMQAEHDHALACLALLGRRGAAAAPRLLPLLHHDPQEPPQVTLAQLQRTLAAIALDADVADRVLPAALVDIESHLETVRNAAPDLDYASELPRVDLVAIGRLTARASHAAAAPAIALFERLRQQERLDLFDYCGYAHALAAHGDLQLRQPVAEKLAAALHEDPRGTSPEVCDALTALQHADPPPHFDDSDLRLCRRVYARIKRLEILLDQARLCENTWR